MVGMTHGLAMQSCQVLERNSHIYGVHEGDTSILFCRTHLAAGFDDVFSYLINVYWEGKT